jgi:subtilase family serine protease
MVIAMAPSLSKLVVVEGGFNSGGGIDYSTITSVMNALASPASHDLFANQISSSWDASGDTNNNPQLMEMAAQGQTFFYASGDSGAPDGGTNGAPASFNYMTMVGGTELSMTNTGAGWQTEQVWDFQFIQGASSGYITVGLPIPDYQQAVNMPAVGGSASYRNSPDVAMCADNIEIVYTQVDTNGVTIQTGKPIPVGGTSAAAPLWAAFTALVNQQAASQGKPTVGFLNPALYMIGQGPDYANCFHDITVGNNTNYVNALTNSHGLFFAAPGYDLCTGWGSPKGINLINVLVGYTGPVFVDFNYTGATKNGSYDYPFKTLAQATNAVSNGGTIIIKTAGSSSETMTIKKPMTITASDGAATIGR